MNKYVKYLSLLTLFICALTLTGTIASAQSQQQPPQEAVAACSGDTSGSSCSFSDPQSGSTVSGTCITPPNMNNLVCAPASGRAQNMPPQRGTQNTTSAPPSSCTPSWSLGNWGACASNGTQTRTVTDSNSCGVTTNEPTTSQSCTYTPVVHTSSSVYTTFGTQNTPSNATGNTTSAGPVYIGSPAVRTTMTSTLSLGSRGSAVISLQQHLVSLNYLTQDSVTGYFGLLTQGAVQRFQCARLSLCSGSPSTNGYGLVGPKTRAALTSTSTSSDPSTSNTTNQSIASQIATLLAQIQALKDKIAQNSAQSTGGSSNTTGTPVSQNVSSCTPSWSTSSWGACASNGTQTRTVTDLNSCGTTSGQLATSQSCTYTPACTPSWSLGNWGACASNGMQTRTITDSNSCGVTTNQPMGSSQACTYTPVLAPASKTQEGAPPVPPQAALDACNGISPGSSCSLPNGSIGACAQIGPYFACKPQ